ncbi:excisionase [Yersinia enterocolitica]|uniref:excisionase n=1 Tax=Yersinia enterocolitica TaxID=630 RepID=UPI001C8DB2A0|nr:excisionase [Yersinia enterocolitica]MBX9477306.1 excisionase [Yersinia enterocolitica]HEI6817133.1 excisionase [Yersinia enterocolitica]
MARMLTLLEWAKEEFGDKAPSERLLKKYAKESRILPPAKKIGREWMVDKEARYVGELAAPQLPKTASPKLRRIIADGSPSSNS